MGTLKSYLKKKLNDKQIFFFRNLFNDLKAFIHINNLDKLAIIYGTDKFGSHHYTSHYKTHFKRYKYKKINLLEIGVGGYENPLEGGQSLRMWKKFFPRGKIYSIDIYDKSDLQENRIKIYQGSQVDHNFLNIFLKEVFEFDIIIDDGSHINEHVIETFKILFPRLKEGGIYVVEDVQTSYWKDYGGDSENLTAANTIMNFFRSLTDCLNNVEFIKPGYTQTYFDKKVISIHFYHNLIFIYKGSNDEKSNFVIDNERLKTVES